MTYTEDYGLCADGLDDKYNPDGDGEHPAFTRSAWREFVQQEATLSGYWSWVEWSLRLQEEGFTA